MYPKGKKLTRFEENFQHQFFEQNLANKDLKDLKDHREIKAMKVLKEVMDL
jgi:hypothetical protein